MVICLNVKKAVEVILMAVLNIALPTLDIFSDLSLIASFLHTRDYQYAASLSVPFLLSYSVMISSWWRRCKRRDLSVLPVLLNLYPQAVAVQVMLLTWKGDQKGAQKKIKLEQELSEQQTIFEALPTLTIMSCILKIEEDKIMKMSKSVVGGYYLLNVLRENKFWISYNISKFSATFGMAKCLKNGVARILQEVNFFSMGFVLILASIFMTIIGNGNLLLVMIGKDSQGNFLGPKSINIYQRIAINFAITKLPGFAISVVTTYNYRAVWRTMLAHPSTFVLPIFTYYTFKTNNIGFQKPKDRWQIHKLIKESEIELQLSKRWTIANIVFKAIGFLIEAFIIGEGDLSVIAGNPVMVFSNHPLMVGHVYAWPSALIGILLTLLVITSCFGCIEGSFEYSIYRVEQSQNINTERPSSGHHTIHVQCGTEESKVEFR